MTCIILTRVQLVRSVCDMDGVFDSRRQFFGQRSNPDVGGAGLPALIETSLLCTLRVAAHHVRRILLQHPHCGHGEKSLALEHCCVDRRAIAGFVLYGGHHTSLL